MSGAGAGMEAATTKTEPEIWVPLSRGQAELVVQQAITPERPGASLVRVLLALGGHDQVVMADLERDPKFKDPKIAQVLIISLMVLSAFSDTKEHRASDIAEELGFSRSTLIRYLKTWLAVGVLEQDNRTRTYRLALRWRADLTANSPISSNVSSAT
jgi:hypothetical protein